MFIQIFFVINWFYYIFYYIGINIDDSDLANKYSVMLVKPVFLHFSFCIFFLNILAIKYIAPEFVFHVLKFYV